MNAHMEVLSPFRPTSGDANWKSSSQIPLMPFLSGWGDVIYFLTDALFLSTCRLKFVSFSNSISSLPLFFNYDLMGFSDLGSGL